MQVIRFKGQAPTPSTFKLCNLGDNKWEKIEFHIPRYAGMNATLHLAIGDKSDVVNLSSDGVYTVERKHTQQAGIIRGYITIVGDGDIVWHSDEFKMIVGDVRDDGPEIDNAYPSAFEDALNALAEIKTIHEDISQTADDVTEEAKKAQNASIKASESSDAAAEAANAARDILNVVGDIKEAIDQSERSAKQASEQAERCASEAKQAAESATASADSARDMTEQVVGFVGRAEQAAKDAKESSEQSGNHASQAATDADRARQALQASIDAQEKAASDAKRADRAASSATQSAIMAERYANEAKQSAQSKATDHTLLTNRDMPGQHSIGAITGLTNRLIDVDSRPMTSEEILAIMK